MWVIFEVNVSYILSVALERIVSRGFNVPSLPRLRELLIRGPRPKARLRYVVTSDWESGTFFSHRALDHFEGRDEIGLTPSMLEAGSTPIRQSIRDVSHAVAWRTMKAAFDAGELQSVDKPIWELLVEDELGFCDINKWDGEPEVWF